MKKHWLKWLVPWAKKVFKPKAGGERSYAIHIPEEVFLTLSDIASLRATSLNDVIQRVIKVGLIVETIDRDESAQIIVRENGKEFPIRWDTKQEHDFDEQ
jgi:hypothetical protein